MLFRGVVVIRRRPGRQWGTVERMQAGANDLDEHRLSSSTFADGALVDGAGEIIRNYWTHLGPHWIFLT
jgi:hypothetical protein